MRHTVVVDDRLLDDARAALGTTGVRETIEASLKEAIQRKRREQVRAALGHFPLDLDAATLARMRADE